VQLKQTDVFSSQFGSVHYRSSNDEWEQEFSVHTDFMFMAKLKKLQGSDKFNDF